MRHLVRTVSVPSSVFFALAILGLVAACASDNDPVAPSPQAPIVEGNCSIADGADVPDSLDRIDCLADYDALADAPLDDTIPGALSVKVILDRADHGRLYFQNSKNFKVHYAFASTHLAGSNDPLPPVATISDFNQMEYYSPDRRFILGAVTHYAGPNVWALEIAPYDMANSAMVQRLFETVRSSAYFGPALAFHPTSVSVEEDTKGMSLDVPIKSTDEIYQGIDYQPLNLGEAYGRLVFELAANLPKTYLSFQDIVVLDRAPNDITAVLGLITEEFQTPLSHLNILSENRRTPNMGLRGAMSNAALRSLESKWVHLTVGPSNWSIEEATKDQVDAFWEIKRPAKVLIPSSDLAITDLRSIDDVVSIDSSIPLRERIKFAIPSFGGKAAHFSELRHIGDKVPVPPGFGVPIFYYDQFMKQNAFDVQVRALQADAAFAGDPAVRDAQLSDLRAAMAVGTVDDGFQQMLRNALGANLPGIDHVRFRSSTNAEDLEGFTGAGLYLSMTGHPSDWPTVLDAVRQVWASVWLFRAYEEREYRGIDHLSVGMALLCITSFPKEAANGVALTANPFDPSGLEPAFYINAQIGGTSVVLPPDGVQAESMLSYFFYPGQPTVYLSSSTLVQKGQHVLATSQISTLGRALDAIHDHFSAAYGPGAGNSGWYGMDVEFKFDASNASATTPTLFIKQARPSTGRGDVGAAE